MKKKQEKQYDPIPPPELTLNTPVPKISMKYRQYKNKIIRGYKNIMLSRHGAVFFLHIIILNINTTTNISYNNHNCMIMYHTVIRMYLENKCLMLSSL